MDKSPHLRLGEMVSEFGWTLGIPTESGPMHTNKDVRGDVEGRVGTLFCWYPGSDPMWWSAGVLWRADMSKRDRKKAKKQSNEFLAEFVGSELRRIERDYLSMNADRPAKHLRKYGSGLGLGTGGAFFSALGEPPLPADIMTIVKNLAVVADRIEERLEMSG